jgi:hypothetical protein
MSDTSSIKDLLASLFTSVASSNSAAKAAIQKLFVDQYEITKAADSTLLDATTAAGLAPQTVKYAGKVVGAFITASTGITGSSTDNAVFTLKSYPLAGTTGTTVATLTTSATQAKFARTSMTLSSTAANLAVVAGGSLTLEIAKGGSGYTLPLLSCFVQVENDE